MLKKKMWLVVVTFLITGTTLAQPFPTTSCSDPSATPNNPENPDEGCSCPDGTTIPVNGTCPAETPLDTYIWVLLGLGGAYGLIKLRHSSVRKVEDV